jgi:WD40 repeat protein
MYGMALFDGTIRTIDLSTKQVASVYSEHTGRTWAVENLRMGVFATCGDDAKIKVWDVRLRSSVLTISGQVGRVSQLLRISDSMWASAACDSAAKIGGFISFWDMRMVPA